MVKIMSGNPVVRLAEPEVFPRPSGIGDEYTDDAGESDDGDADAGGFVYGAEAAGAERRAEEGATRVEDETRDRRWHNMYR